jgi:hypothetical protein
LSASSVLTLACTGWARSSASTSVSRSTHTAFDRRGAITIGIGSSVGERPWDVQEGLALSLRLEADVGKGHVVLAAVDHLDEDDVLTSGVHDPG